MIPRGRNGRDRLTPFAKLAPASFQYSASISDRAEDRERGGDWPIASWLALIATGSPRDCPPMTLASASSSVAFGRLRNISGSATRIAE